MAIDKPTDAELKRLKKNLLIDKGPSSRQQSYNFVFWKAIGNHLGQPFDATRIPLSKLHQMRRDPMIAFALHYIKVPLLRAPWTIKSSDAQVSAFIDQALRKIYPRLVLQYLNSLDFGYAGIVKRFEQAPVSGTYIDPSDAEAKEKPIWSEGDIDPIVWRTFVGLPPEQIEPLWTPTGDFNGFRYDVKKDISLSFPVVGAEDLEDGRKIPLETALWITNEKDSVFGCSPYDEPVLTTDGYIPIGELDPSIHGLVSYESNSDSICRSSKNRKGYEFEVSTRPHDGDLFTINTEDGKSARVTPNHKLTAKWVDGEFPWVVYLMRKGDSWRIGTTVLHRQEKDRLRSGVSSRLCGEKADDAWIIDTFDSKRDALILEKNISYKYNIPDLKFTSKHDNNLWSQEDLDNFWSHFDSASGARKLLADNNLIEDFPFYERSSDGKTKTFKSGRAKMTVFAANLLPDLMELPTDPGEGNTPEWHKFTLDRNHFDGTVYSLNVLPHHHYVSSGIITQNSPWGYPRIGYAFRYWWSYWYRWALADRHFEKDADPPAIVRYPDDPMNEVLDDEGNAVDFRSIALGIGEQARSGSTIAMPSNVIESDVDGRPTAVPEWDLTFVKGASNFDVFDKTFSNLEILKLRSIFVPEQAFFEGQGGSSSRNVAAEMGDSFQEAQAVLMAELDDHINQYIIPQLVKLNFPEFRGEVKKITKGFGTEDLEFAKALIQLIGQNDPTQLGVDIRMVLDEMGIPLKSPQVLEAEKQKAIEEAQALQPPTGQETIPGQQAGTATVPDKTSDTGFSVKYVQPGESIFLADDMQLPNSKMYKDKTILALTRQHRAIWQSQFSEIYDKFADYVASGIFDEGETEVVELAQDDNDPDERAKFLIDRFALSFGIARNRSLELIKKIMRQGAKNELRSSKLSLDWDFDNSGAAAWAEQHAATLVQGVAETTRHELRQFVAEGIRDNLSNQEIANNIREHFSEFPGWKSDRVARTETMLAYNFSTLFAGEDVGIKRVQALDARDGPTDEQCERRNGKIFDIAEAFNQTAQTHPNDTLSWRLLKATNLSVDYIPRDQIEDDKLAWFDPESDTIFMAEDISEEDKEKYLIMIGDKLV